MKVDLEGNIIRKLPDVELVMGDHYRDWFIIQFNEELTELFGKKLNKYDLMDVIEKDGEENKTYYKVAPEQVPIYLLKRTKLRSKIHKMVKSFGDLNELTIASIGINLTHKFREDIEFCFKSLGLHLLMKFNLFKQYILNNKHKRPLTFDQT